jgi:tungstate transport system substrate-binding protein
MLEVRKLTHLIGAAGLSAGLFAAPALGADGDFIVVQSTTSTQNSGLFDAILPIFKEKTGTDVRVVAVGTGQAIKNAGNCDGDVLLVHAKPAELQFIAEGGGVERFDVMYNDFVVIGPEDDPAGIAGKSIDVALQGIAEASAPFASRGDDSGTNKKEILLWADAGVDPSSSSGDWYRETGSGMGATINAAVGMGAYTLTDRATWIAHQNKDGFKILVEGDDRLFNQYGVILVNPERCPAVKAELGQEFIDWLLGDGQASIAAYEVDGQQLFFPNAGGTM